VQFNFWNLVAVLIGIGLFEVIKLRSDAHFHKEREPNEGWGLFAVAVLLELIAGVIYSSSLGGTIPWASFLGGYALPRLLSDGLRGGEFGAPSAANVPEDSHGRPVSALLSHWSSAVVVGKSDSTRS